MRHQRQRRYRQIDGKQPQEAVGVELAGCALVVVRRGQHIGNQEARNHIKQLHRQPAADQVIGIAATQVVQHH
ncbi:hypothetical protein G6F22_021067 [Rhizopus arrhizus]|nr:hypothetical protein G6F22_021067 [Rhizopus arrhizus]